ncbi:hypothetical protein JTE90_010915 [Oedothorax gibbosus]|uniref:Uncharacterized protein n=1 Tax=Oedothorax gibbosus TaxID=931172 RepID=A0AAV6UG01_9ARAC|nr:hypothetical protein JTE90_010915 [Oedothorax gibbosus]
MRSGAAFAMALTWMTLVLVLFVVDASPVTRRLETTTSSLPVVVTSDWDEGGDFDMDEGDDDWLGDAVPVSPSSLPFRSDFDDDDYEDDDDSTSKRRPSDDDDVDVQDAEELDEESEKADEQSRRSSAEFLFMPGSDNRLMLQDDDGEQSGLIKVRHTGKSQYPEIQSNSLEEDNDVDDDEMPSKDDGQFEFTIGQDEDAEDKSKDDFVLEDTRSSKDESDDENIPKPATRNIEDLDDDDDDEDDDLVFESPEEDSQVIYGDPVFLY